MRAQNRLLLMKAALALVFFFCLQASASASVSLIMTEDNSDDSSVDYSSVQVTEVKLENGDNYVSYPQISGLTDETVQQTINDDIIEAASIEQRLITFSTLQDGSSGLVVDYTSYLCDSIFSVVISAKGIIDVFPDEHEYTALTYDLTTGERITLSDVFSDVDAAVLWMESELVVYAEDNSYYFENDALTPLPTESFAVDAYGITFYYPYDQYSYISGYSGSVQFQYGELQQFLISESDAIPDLLNALMPEYTDQEILENIEACVSAGTLPCQSVVLSDSIPDLISEYRLLVQTPDLYPGGRYFQLEAPEFRGILLLSDALTDTWDDSVVKGILATRINLFGIQTGVTTRDRWHEILGEPVTSVYYDSSVAFDYGLPIGTADYYTIEDRQLMLYADENNVLYAIRLTN